MAIFRDNPGVHFNPYFNKKGREKRDFERVEERKTVAEMGERRKARQQSVHEIQAVSVRKAPVTLAKLKWGDDK